MAVAGAFFMWYMFQSTPDLINRENFITVVRILTPHLFQSTPDLINRENLMGQRIIVAMQNVSIHSRFN